MAKKHGGLAFVTPPVCRLILGTSFGDFVSYDLLAQLCDAYRECGGNCVDTALVYYNSEDLLGRWMEDRRCRAEMIVVAKIAHSDAGGSRLRPENIRSDLQRTLDLLRTDYVDVLMLHRDDPAVPVAVVIEALAQLQVAGKARSIAASNWSTGRLEAAGRHAASIGSPGFNASSVYYGLAPPTWLPWDGCIHACDAASERWYVRTGIPLLAWSPLGFGYLATAPGQSDGASGVGVARDATTVDWTRVFASATARERRARVHEMARRKSVSMAQIAVAWLLEQPMRPFAVVGPRTVAEVRDLFRAFDVDLSAADLDWLSST